MTNIAEILANPSAHGFEWAYGPVAKNGMELMANAPYMKHENVEKLTATFGDRYLLDIANGTSGKVRDQGVVRNMVWDDRKLASQMDVLKEAIVKAALGQRTRRTNVVIVKEVVRERVYVADDGTEFTDKGEFLAHQIDLKQNAE